MARLFEKDPNEVLDLTIDWSDLLDAVGSPSDTISSSTWVVPTAGSPDSDELVQDSSSIDGANTIILLSSGQAGTSYKLKNTIVTSLASTFQRVITVVVIDQSEESLASGLVAEDGTGLSNANSYASRADVDAYFAARFNTVWFDNQPSLKDSAIIKASDYITQKYRRRWKGVRVVEDQALDWPRYGVQLDDFKSPSTEPRPSIFDGLSNLVDEDIVPLDIKHATAELALRQITGGDLNPDSTGGGPIKRVKAGSVEVEFADQVSAVQAETKVFRAVADILKPYLKPLRHKLIRS